MPKNITDAYITGDAGNQMQESRIAEETHHLDYIAFGKNWANGSEGYLPSTAAMEYGCYEGYITRYERGSGEAFAQEFVDMATQLKEGQ